MATTNDKYELPIASADTQRELANLLGITKEKVKSTISKGEACNGRIRGYRIIKVEIEDYIDPLDEV